MKDAPEPTPLHRALAEDLRALSVLPLTSEAELASWDAAAEKFQEKLYSHYESIQHELPGELEHYLTDSDIRFKDDGYRERQEKFLKSLVERLDRRKTDLP